MKALLNQTFWHGTCEGYLPSIMDQGLLPSRFRCGHVCLTNDPQIALFWARIWNNNPFGPGGSPVLIEIPSISLSEASVVCESATINISAYGHGNPGRRPEDLLSLRNDWERLFKATGCLGASDTVSVSSSRIIPVKGLRDQSVKEACDELRTGECDDDANKWLKDNIQPPATKVTSCPALSTT